MLEIRGTRASNHLDFVRGFAALAVLVYHVRYRFFLDFADVGDRNALTLTWYSLTAFGHDAVMVFFVLSGYLVGGSIVRACQAGRWNWRDYLTARAVRLWVVLAPALALTVFWDTAGLHWFSSADIYTGRSATYVHDYFDVASRSGTAALVGNLAFLQTIVVPTYGSNEALWSLANEFWYYIAGPLLAVPLLTRASLIGRISYSAALLTVLWFVGPALASYFPIWLLGGLVGLLPRTKALARRPRLGLAFGVAFLALWALASHTAQVRALLGNSLWAIDATTGFVFSAYLYLALHDGREVDRRWYGRLAGTLAGFSYTLYLTHLPLLVFSRAVLVPARPWSVDVLSIATAVSIACLAVGFAWCVARFTESHTDTIRRAVTTIQKQATAPTGSLALSARGKNME